jgi:hypothetical protein
MRVLGVHGIRNDGATNTDLMLADLARLGWSTVDVDYARVGVLTARWRAIQFRRARQVFAAARPGDAVVAHSYGCLLVLRAMELGMQFGSVFFFGAALNSDFTFPILGMRRLYNIHNPADRALGLGSMLVWHDFGDLGKAGYAGPPDPRIVDIPASAADPQHEPLHHSCYFLAEARPAWVAFIDRQLRREAADG